MHFWSLYNINLPLKVLNVIGSKRESRLFHFVQYIQCAIEDFKKLSKDYENDLEATEILEEITIQFFARLRN